MAHFNFEGHDIFFEPDTPLAVCAEIVAYVEANDLKWFEKQAPVLQRMYTMACECLRKELDGRKPKVR